MVTVNCAGKATDRRTSVPAASPLPTPQQPSLYHGEIIIEAENMDYSNVKSIRLVNPYGDYFPDIVEFAGNGYVDFGTNTAGKLRHKLTLKVRRYGSINP